MIANIKEYEFLMSELEFFEFKKLQNVSKILKFP